MAAALSAQTFGGLDAQSIAFFKGARAIKYAFCKNQCTREMRRGNNQTEEFSEENPQLQVDICRQLPDPSSASAEAICRHTPSLFHLSNYSIQLLQLIRLRQT
ncbi:hypothetical protein L2E82_49982 [Cichorium intybus]|nr:hypothetical protein L2E82_49982 [Cichorium intybus]